MSVCAPQQNRGIDRSADGTEEGAPGRSSNGRLSRAVALPAEASELATARRFFDSAAADFGFDEVVRYQVTTARHEAVSNAIQHGAPFASGVVYLGAAAASDGELVCTVHDAGILELPDEAAPDTTAEQGRGLPLIRLLVDEVGLETGPQGAVVRLAKRAGRKPTSQPAAGPGASSELPAKG
jgi:anti-sigma regulatory factor (Ser/Thr protein kinase)